jgi:hypothetical protein
MSFRVNRISSTVALGQQEKLFHINASFTTKAINEKVQINLKRFQIKLIFNINIPVFIYFITTFKRHNEAIFYYVRQKTVEQFGNFFSIETFIISRFCFV